MVGIVVGHIKKNGVIWGVYNIEKSANLKKRVRSFTKSVIYFKEEQATCIM